MRTADNNRLIAEFTGMTCHHNDSNVFIFNTENGNDIVSIEDLKYDTDWNLLMPVIEKILDISLNLDTMEMYYNITDSIPNIEQTHKEVVEFIKWYKNENN